MSTRQDRSNFRTTPEQIAVSLPYERWQPVIGFDGYFVSDYGRVCGVDRVIPCESMIRNRTEQLRRGCLLRPGAQASGHVTVALGRGNTRGVHVLVLTAFVGPCPEGEEALHADDNASNNRLSNLRWGTRSENLSDAISNGRIPLGEQVYNAKLTVEAVRYIRANPQFSLNSLGVRFGVSAAAVKQVRDGVTWKYVA